ncbi:ncl-1 [Trichonephila clavata]|uniref:Ncl-1 n=1 Tax=Trichonephila clavata TaxID=2740835 RepID=A0A8X6L2Z2_TRICU|nr:ncl-1 [Trichonephila clavata]
MREPSDTAVCGKGFYMCDFKSHCVIEFSEKGNFLSRIGYENVPNFPNGIDVSDVGDVLVGDSHGYDCVFKTRYFVIRIRVSLC